MRDILDIVAWSTLAVIAAGAVIPDKIVPPPEPVPAATTEFWQTPDTEPPIRKLGLAAIPPFAMPPKFNLVANRGCGCGCADCTGGADCKCKCEGCKCRPRSDGRIEALTKAVSQLTARVADLEKRLAAQPTQVLPQPKAEPKPVTKSVVRRTYQPQRVYYYEPVYTNGWYGGSCSGGVCR